MIFTTCLKICNVYNQVQLFGISRKIISFCVPKTLIFEVATLTGVFVINHYFSVLRVTFGLVAKLAQNSLKKKINIMYITYKKDQFLPFCLKIITEIIILVHVFVLLTALKNEKSYKTLPPCKFPPQILRGLGRQQINYHICLYFDIYDIFCHKILFSK